MKEERKKKKRKQKARWTEISLYSSLKARYKISLGRDGVGKGEGEKGGGWKYAS